MSDRLVLRYELPPLTRTSSNVMDDVERHNAIYRDIATDLCRRLEEHGVEDGYEITMETRITMKVVAFTPACALLLKCWGGYRTREDFPHA